MRVLGLRFFRMFLLLLGFSVAHLFLFGFLGEGVLPAAVFSYFGAFAGVFDRRWLLGWPLLVFAGLFVRGASAAGLALLVWLVCLLSPLAWAGGSLWVRAKALFFFWLGLAASGAVLLLPSEWWRDLAPHPLGPGVFQAIPTPVDAPWHLLGYYIWERTYALHKTRPSWRWITGRD